eukprot:762783-Hanusia_phi.AAC.1
MYRTRWGGSMLLESRERNRWGVLVKYHKGGSTAICHQVWCLLVAMGGGIERRPAGTVWMGEYGTYGVGWYEADPNYRFKMLI